MNQGAAKTIRDAERLLDQGQRARLNDMAALEKLLVIRLLAELSRDLQEGEDGRVRSTRGSVAVAGMVDAVFKAVEKRGLRTIGRDAVKDMRGVLDLNARYYGQIAEPKGGSFPEIKKLVDAILRKRLGLTPKHQINPKGYMGELSKTDKAREEVKKMIAKAIAAGRPMRELERAVKIKVAGTKNTPGVLERNLGGFLLDAYQVADAVSNNEFAKRLDLRYFIYSGGLIETSRPFCIKRNNKVYTTEEATDPKTGWATDPTLPRTKEEKDSGSVADYAPLEDRGRWNCRHRLLYISEQEAKRRRPDLFTGK
jgi:hypothetical protein